MSFHSNFPPEHQYFALYFESKFRRPQIRARKRKLKSKVIYFSIFQTQCFHVFLDAQNSNGPVDPGARIDGNESAIIVVFWRIHFRGRISTPPGNPIIFCCYVHRPLVRWPQSQLSCTHPAALTSGCDERAGLPARQSRHFPQLRNGPTALGGITVLDPCVKETHTRVHQGGPVGWIQRGIVATRLDAGTDATNHSSPRVSARRCYTGGSHGGWRH